MNLLIARCFKNKYMEWNNRMHFLHFRAFHNFCNRCQLSFPIKFQNLTETIFSALAYRIARGFSYFFLSREPNLKYFSWLTKNSICCKLNLKCFQKLIGKTQGGQNQEILHLIWEKQNSQKMALWFEFYFLCSRFSWTMVQHPRR